MSVVSGISFPNLPAAPQQYERSFQEQYSNVLRLFFANIVNKVNAPIPHSSYYDTTTQANPVANAVNLFQFDSVISQFQMRRGMPTSKIYVANPGLYNFQFSAQLDKTGGGASTVYIWPRVNGVNVPYSATKVVIDGPNAEIVPAWNFMIDMKPNDYFELAWQSSDTAVVILAEAAASNYPAIPSVILTANWISNYDVY